MQVCRGPDGQRRECRERLNTQQEGGAAPCPLLQRGPVPWAWLSLSRADPDPLSQLPWGGREGTPGLGPRLCFFLDAVYLFVHEGFIDYREINDILPLLALAPHFVTGNKRGETCLIHLDAALAAAEPTGQRWRPAPFPYGHWDSPPCTCPRPALRTTNGRPGRGPRVPQGHVPLPSGVSGRTINKGLV